MPKKQFAFEKGGSKRLKLSWGAYSKNLKIELDGEYLAGCRGRELKAGKEFPLPDGSRLSVRMTKPAFPIWIISFVGPNAVFSCKIKVLASPCHHLARGPNG